MVHILKNKSGQFYFLTVTKKGNGFEPIAKSSEFYTQKHNCEKSVKAEAGEFNGNAFNVFDHTIKNPKLWSFFQADNGGYIKTPSLIQAPQSEIEFVQKLKK